MSTSDLAGTSTSRVVPAGSLDALARSGGAARLRELFDRPGHVRIVGAHNPLGARLAERAGFDGVWSSGLEISASHGVPDADILTMTELLAIARAMAMAVDIPVVADCDAGYGNSSNVMHMIRQYEAAGIAAVSIEDKPFPKLNSFIPGRQELAPIEEFAGKLAAAKAAQRHPDLMVIARIEALIAGRGMEEALRRGAAYAEAGADAVLIHAKGDSPEPILTFLRRWRLPLPVVVVPTTYHTITADELMAAGAKMVIYANQGLRAGIKAVSDVFATILRDGRTTAIESSIAPLATVFDLQGMTRLKEEETRFLRQPGDRVRAVVLPSGRRSDACDSTPSVAALTIAGMSVLERQAESLRLVGIRTVTVVTATPDVGVSGVVTLAGAAPSGTADALCALATTFAGRTVVLAHDVLFDPAPLRHLLAEDYDTAALVDVGHDRSGAHREGATPITLSLPATSNRRLAGTRDVRVVAVGDPAAAAQFAGAAILSAKAFAALSDAAVKRTNDGQPAGLAELLGDLVTAGWPIHAIQIASGWAELHTTADVVQATGLLTEAVA